MNDLLGGTSIAPYNQYDAPATPEGRMVSTPTLKQRLELAVAQAEAKLADVKRARELFEKNPDLEELLNIMQRGRF